MKTAPSEFNDFCIALAGLGGIGGICARTIADCGVGRLQAADCGVFERLNYPCQYFAMPPAIGEAKTKVAARGLANNAQTRVEVFHGDLTDPGKAKRLVSSAHIAVSAVDNYKAQMAVALAAEAAQIPFALISMVGLTGMHTIYRPGEDSYSAQWRRFGYRVDELTAPPGPEGASARSRRALARQQLLYSFAVGGFHAKALEAMFDDYENDRPLSYYNLAGVNYAGATLAMNNVLSYLSGQGRAVFFPEMICFDFSGCRIIRADELKQRIYAVNKAFHRGRDVLLDTVLSWQGRSEWT